MHLIHVYTRKQAIEDGTLIDVSEMAREAGIKYPVALTLSLYHGLVVPTVKLYELGQDVNGRLWDVLWMFRTMARSHQGREMAFTVVFMIDDEQEPGGYRHEEVELKALIGPGDDGEPVITIMLPDED